MKILLVEDEKKTSSYLRKGLTESGFTVDIAEQGEEDLRLVQTRPYPDDRRRQSTPALGLEDSRCAVAREDLLESDHAAALLKNRVQSCKNVAVEENSVPSANDPCARQMIRKAEITGAGARRIQFSLDFEF